MQYRTRQIQSLYRTLLQREVDTISLYAFDLFLWRGGTIGEVKARLLGSSEYFRRRGRARNDRFLKALYRDVLGCDIDSKALLQGLQALENGMSRSALAFCLVAGAEAGRQFPLNL
jgi:hypothetical protein